MRTVRTSAVCLGVVYLVAIASLGPLLGSTADSSTAFVDHFASDANVRLDLVASLLLAAASVLLVWTIVLIRHAVESAPDTRRRCDLLGVLSVVSASGLLVAAGLLATVPLTTSIGNITDDPGIEPPVQAGIAQAGTVVLLMSMLVVGATFVLAARLGRAAGSVPRWIAVTAWIVAAALILGMSIALLFPFGAWLIALGLTWKTDEPAPRRDDGSLDWDAMPRRRVEQAPAMARDLSKFLAAEKVLWSRYGITPTERRVKLRAGNEVRIQQVGDGPPLVFIHGVGVAGSSWVLLADALKHDFSCLLVDRPGCGLSDPLPGGPTQTSDEFKRSADELTVDILDGLGLETAPVACTSMGGFFGLRAAIANPDRITKVVSYSWAMGSPMVNVPMMMRLGSPRPMRAIMIRMPITTPAIKMMFKQVGMKRAIETGTFDDDMIAWSIAVMKHTETFRSETRNNPFVKLRGLNPEVLLTDEELARLRSPVLLLWGEEDTNAGEPEAKAFAARLPDATLEIVREAGHTPWIDELDFCAAKTRAFLST